ncbi:hypothetical protein JHK84_055408 [Glycine max]|nr:hypothetical protein JHK85_056382 [Glycine max]KAG5074177.1 hypothetical protein JHK84_055408 [Glycine max]
MALGPIVGDDGAKEKQRYTNCKVYTRKALKGSKKKGNTISTVNVVPPQQKPSSLGSESSFAQTMFKTLAISFSTMTLFTRITPLYGSSLQYAGLATLVWGWIVVSFFTWFVGIAMAEICSSFPAYARSQTLQSIILLSTGTNKGGGYFTPKWLFLCMYIGLTITWEALNTFALEVIDLIDIVSIWWQGELNRVRSLVNRIEVKLGVLGGYGNSDMMVDHGIDERNVPPSLPEEGQIPVDNGSKTSSSSSSSGDSGSSSSDSDSDSSSASGSDAGSPKI